MIKDSLEQLYKQVEDRGLTTHGPIQGLEEFGQKIQSAVITSMADYLTSKPFNETEFYEQPDYYAGYPEFAGRKIRETHLEEASVFYWEELNMMEYFFEKDQHRVISTMPQWAKDYGVTILCDYSKPAHDQDYSTQELNIPIEECVWGNTEILSEEDWDKLTEENFDLQEQSDLIWHEIDAYMWNSVWAILDRIHDDIAAWSGEDGLQDRISVMLDEDEFRLQMTLLHHELDQLVLDPENWYNQIDAIVSKYEREYDDIVYA